MKSLKIVFTSFFLISGLLLGSCGKNENIGTIEGAEYEKIIIDGKAYEYCTDPPYSASDKNKLPGKIKSGDKTFNIYSIEGTDDYLYCLWEWEGRIYKLEG